MKFVANGSILSEAAGKVVKAVSIRTTNPILEGIKLSLKGDYLTLSATDTEISIEKTIKVETFMEGETVVPGKIFTEYMKKLEEETDIEFTLENDKLKITYSSSQGFIQTLNASEFPIINKDIKEKSFNIKQKDFKELIAKSAFACSTEEARPVLRGCLLEIEDKKISSIALDGVRLAICRKDVVCDSENIRIIVPQRTLNEITHILDKDEDVLTVIIQKNSMLVEVDNTIIVSRLLEGEFINYKLFIKDEYKSLVRVNKTQLINEIERATVVVTDVKKIVRFDIKENYLTVSANSEVGNMSGNITINLEGNDLGIAFNSKFIMDALKAIDDENVYLYFNSRIDPCIIKPYSGDDYLYLILPLRINV